jgi:hypothetical protein
MTDTPAPAAAEAYLLKAEECARMAAEAIDPSVREAFENAARGWRFLAVQNAATRTV